MKTRFLTAVAMVGLCTGAMAQTMPGETLLLMDTDADRVVTLEEFTELMNPMFGLMDTDGNGRLTTAETGSYIDAEIFTGADANGDGSLSFDEYTAQIRQDFQTADQDGSGVLE